MNIDICFNNHELFTYCYEKKYSGVINNLLEIVENENNLKMKIIFSCIIGDLENVKYCWKEIEKNNSIDLELIKLMIEKSYIECHFDIVSWIIKECEKIDLLVNFSFIHNLLSKKKLYHCDYSKMCIYYNYDFENIFSPLCAKYNKEIFVMRFKILFLSLDERFVYEVKRGIIDEKRIENLYEKYKNTNNPINIHHKNDIAFRIISNRGELKMAKLLWNFSQKINSPIDVRANNDEVFLNSMKPNYIVKDFDLDDILYGDDYDDGLIGGGIDFIGNNIQKKVNKMTVWLCSICDDYDVFEDYKGNINYEIKSDDIEIKKMSIFDENEDIMV